MTLRPEDPKHRDEDSKKNFIEGDESVQLNDLEPKKPDTDRDEQVKGGRMNYYE